MRRELRFILFFYRNCIFKISDDGEYFFYEQGLFLFKGNRKNRCIWKKVIYGIYGKEYFRINDKRKFFKIDIVKSCKDNMVDILCVFRVKGIEFYF